LLRRRIVAGTEAFCRRCSMKMPMLVLAATLALSACSDKPAETPLPTKQKTIDPVQNKLDAAQDAADKQKEAIDKAAGS
jgi:hypothetical protein